MVTANAVREPAGSLDDSSARSLHESMGLKLFVEGLEGGGGQKLLDLGPVCGENISLFASKVARLYVCDMYLRLMRNITQGRSTYQVWRLLDYPEQAFDGIALWDIIDRLEDDDAMRLVELCSLMIRDGGRVMVFAQPEKFAGGAVNSLVIRHGYRIEPRLQAHLDLPCRPRGNRDLLALLNPFTPVKSFVYRNGLREFILRKT